MISYTFRWSGSRGSIPRGWIAEGATVLRGRPRPPGFPIESGAGVVGSGVGLPRPALWSTQTKQLRRPRRSAAGRVGPVRTRFLPCRRGAAATEKVAVGVVSGLGDRSPRRHSRLPAARSGRGRPVPFLHLRRSTGRHGHRTSEQLLDRDLEELAERRREQTVTQTPAQTRRDRRPRRTVS